MNFKMKNNLTAKEAFASIQVYTTTACAALLCDRRPATWQMCVGHSRLQVQAQYVFICCVFIGVFCLCNGLLDSSLILAHAGAPTGICLS